MKKEMIPPTELKPFKQVQDKIAVVFTEGNWKELQGIFDPSAGEYFIGVAKKNGQQALIIPVKTSRDNQGKYTVVKNRKFYHFSELENYFNRK